MEYTTNYHLPQWQESDRIQMADFNQMCADMEAGIDAARAEAAEGQETLNYSIETIVNTLNNGGKIARIAWGNYVGAGTYGQAKPTQLSFDFYPVLVIVGSNSYSSGPAWPTIMLRGVSGSSAENNESLSNIAVTWTDTGVSWWNYYNADNQNNSNNCTYYYAALGYAM